MYRSKNSELWVAFLTMVLVATLYLVVVRVWDGIPAASEFFGHMLGVTGFVLMLMTETLYSLRKRTRAARWGRMSSWLEFHIITGLVGPFLVLLHTSWKFNGLAGVVTLLMLIVVASGFLGRYIYTAVPRSADGVEVAASVLAQEINRAQTDMDSWLKGQPADLQSLTANLITSDVTGRSFVWGRSIRTLMDRIRWWQMIQRLDPKLRPQAVKLQEMIFERRLLRSQLASLAFARRLLGLWHTVHIPIGMALFTAAFVHIAGAIYYATLLR